MNQEQLESTVKDFFEFQNAQKKIQMVETLIKREQSKDGIKTA
jgi:transcriptional regulatory protein LevR